MDEFINANNNSNVIDDTMVLNDDELRWAHEIKDAIDESTHLRPISDLECAQWAIVSLSLQPPHNGLDSVMEKVHKLQCFREQYSFENPLVGSSIDQVQRCVQEGVDCIRGYVQEQQPGHLVTIDYTGGHYLIVWDRAKFSPSKVQYEQDWRVYQGCTYHLFLIMNSNISAIRQGIAVILECQGMGYLNYDSQFEERRVNELFNYYPFKTQEFFFLHTPTVAIFLYKAVKRFLSDDFNKTVKLDATVDGLEGKRIDALFHIPTFEEAQDRLLVRLEEYLTERLMHQVQYQLPPKPPPLEVENGEGEGVAAQGNAVQDDFAAAMEHEFADELLEDEEEATAEGVGQGVRQQPANDNNNNPQAQQQPQDEFAAAMAEFSAEFQDEEFDEDEEEQIPEAPLPPATFFEDDLQRAADASIMMNDNNIHHHRQQQQQQQQHAPAPALVEESNNDDNSQNNHNNNATQEDDFAAAMAEFAHEEFDEDDDDDDL